MDRIRAAVENIIYYNEDNHYAVLELSDGNDLFTAVGHFPYITQGEILDACGSMTVHPVYGEQFSVESYKSVRPEGADAIERYLAGGAVKGIGPSLAKRIVKKFKADTFRIIEEEPERLAEVRGISEKKAMLISEQVEIKKGIRDAVMYLQDLGISGTMAMRIYEKYGPALYSILEKNPYRLADEIDGIGFRTADSIASRAGIALNSEFRIKCGIQYVLYQAAGDGHTRLPSGILIKEASDLLSVGTDEVEACLAGMQIEGRIMLTGEHGEYIALSSCYYAERNVALQLDALDFKAQTDSAFFEKRLKRIIEKSGILPDEKQKEAVLASAGNGVLIITGGPGTGKTTTIKTIIRFFEEDGDSIMLAAPTGRAAKRMTEATGCEARTIHRLLEYTGVPGDQSAQQSTGTGLTESYGGSGNAGGSGSTSGKGRFLRDEKDPLEADVLIVDEASMIDIFLMEALLKAVVPGTRLILVGDASQLPSVGPGNVLKDMIGCGAFATVFLDRIFRQEEASDIVINAHRINSGEDVDLSKRSRDFLFIKRNDTESILKDIKTLLTEKLPSYVGCDPMDIQVITPARKGALGVELLNTELQSFLNPPSHKKTEKKYGKLCIRTGDKVMQIKNDYGLEWERRDENGMLCEKGAGVFNGDMGTVEEVDEDMELITVMFDDDRVVYYDHKHLQELEPAYAVTVHKSQGSEYPAVIIPVYPGPSQLMNRNLLYTAVTRARKCVCLVGSPEVFFRMEKNNNESLRYSGLVDRLKEVFSGSAPYHEDHGFEADFGEDPGEDLEVNL